MEAIIIEEISKGHKLIGRHKFEQYSLCIGRGYHNDIIVNDPHVCPEHLCIQFDGEHWVVFDQESLNGSFLGDSKQSAHQHIIHSGDIITIGKSQFRLVFPNHPVAESVQFSPFESIVNFARHPAILTAAILLFSYVAGYIYFLNKATEANFTQLLVPAIGITLMFALWPLGVALTSHLTKNDARVLSQVGISFLFFNLMWVSDGIDNILAFNFSSHWPVIQLFTIVPIAIAFSMFWFNCYISFHMSALRRKVIAASLTLLFFGGNFLVGLSNQPDFTTQPKYNATVMPPAFLLTPATPVEKFIDNSHQLFAKTEKEALENKE